MQRIFIGLEWIPNRGLTSNPVYLNTENLDLSISIWGRSGSGKSYLFFYLIENLVLHCKTPVIILDRTGQALGLSKPNLNMNETWRKYMSPASVPIEYFNPLMPDQSTFQFGLQYNELLAESPHFTIKALSSHFEKYFSLTKKETRKLEALLTKKLVFEKESFSLENLKKWLMSEKTFGENTDEIVYQVELFRKSKISNIFRYDQPEWSKLLNEAKAYIVDVSDLTIPQQRLISQYICNSLLLWAKRKGEPSITELESLKLKGKPLRVVFAIDEVHDIAPSKSFPLSRLSLERLIREGRKYKVSALLATQTFIGTSSVIRSTGIKFFFRMNPEETNYIVRETGLPNQEGRLIPRLPIRRESIALMSSPDIEQGVKFMKIPERMSTHGKIKPIKVKKKLKIEKGRKEAMKIDFKLSMEHILNFVHGKKRGKLKPRKGEDLQIKKSFYPIYLLSFSFKEKKSLLRGEMKIGIRKIPICGLTGNILTDLDPKNLNNYTVGRVEDSDVAKIKPSVKPDKLSSLLTTYYKENTVIKKVFRLFSLRFKSFFSLPSKHEPIGVTDIKLLLYPVYILKYVKKDGLKERIRLKVLDGSKEKIKNLKQMEGALINKATYLLLKDGD